MYLKTEQKYRKIAYFCMVNGINYLNRQKSITLNIRNITLDDASAVCRIYNHYIENTVVTFETSPVTEEEIQKRICDVVESDCPWYIGEINGEIIGYVYLHNFHPREAFFKTKEVAIYLHKDYSGKGLGSVLLESLLNKINPKKIHVLMAGITIPNEKSIKMHEKFGFKQISYMKEVGWKFDQWRDVGYWQLTLDAI